MAQDLRELFKKDRETAEERYKMPEGHHDGFMELLDTELPVKKRTGIPWLKIAASLALLVAAGWFYSNRIAKTDLSSDQVAGHENVKETKISLGDLSPDLKKVETYYVANINLALSELEVSQENKEMTNSFMTQLAKLNSEYESLNTELNTLGPNDQTITALIKNLQLRLQLLQKLKTKLNELKSSKNEQVEII